MQYTFWAETILANTHTSMDEPPHSSLFSSTGRVKPSLSQAFTGLANSISDVLTKQSTSGGTGSATYSNSPGKSVELRSKYIGQLKELVSLYDMGALTDYTRHLARAAILR